MVGEILGICPMPRSVGPLARFAASAGANPGAGFQPFCGAIRRDFAGYPERESVELVPHANVNRCRDGGKKRAGQSPRVEPA